jgi:anti-sigma factor (TIGR02949 family)
MNNPGCCHEVLRSLSTYVDGELAPSEMLTVEEHIEGCCECADRVKFERAVRKATHDAVSAERAPDALRARMALVLAQERQAQQPSSWNAPKDDVLSVSPRMLSWRVVGPLAAAAVLSLVVGSIARRTEPTQAASTSVGSAAGLMSLDTFLEEVVDQHAHPLPPETTNPTDVAKFDQFVGVPVRPVNFQRANGTLLGARMVPIRQSRAAMLQYVMTNGHRVSVYVYNPAAVRMVASPRLRERKAENGPMYVGLVRGYSVAATDRRGVGYALASDLDEQEMLAVDLPQ